jgi:hypothetical protein
MDIQSFQTAVLKMHFYKYDDRVSTFALRQYQKADISQNTTGDPPLYTCAEASDPSILTSTFRIPLKLHSLSFAFRRHAPYIRYYFYFGSYYFHSRRLRQRRQGGQ